MTSIVLRLCLAVVAGKASFWYALSEPRGCEIDNTRSRWPYGDKVSCDRVAAGVVLGPRYWPPAAPARPSNKNSLSFFSLSV